jgi:4-hydroxythreonine-4-phosphate dehydrogenase
VDQQRRITLRSNIIMTHKPLLGITLGDPNGIGPEIIIKALARPEVRALARFVVIGDAACLARAGALVGAPLETRRLDDIAAASESDAGIDVLDLANVDAVQQVIGTVQASAGQAAYEAVITATDLALAGQIDAVVTPPLNKEALHLAGVPEPGHTEILAARAGARRVTMMLVAGSFRVTHVSTHCALREAIARVKTARVLEVITLTQQTMLRLGLTQPRLAVAGLNPHAGEGGLFGDEELREIQPAIDAALALGISVAATPQPPDTVFYQMHARQRYDAVVAMYHDQGHIPTKLLGFDEGVNVTLGLPIIRTSVDHGTAFDIAGTGQASPSSLIEAIVLAASLARGRQAEG